MTTYVPTLPPNIEDSEAMLRWFVQELRRVQEQLEGPQLPELGAPPAKPQALRMYFADGTSWNPGSGRGVYLYDPVGPTWRFLG